LQACYELDDSSDCSSDSEDDNRSHCSEDDEDYDGDKNNTANNGEAQETESPDTALDLPSAVVVDDDLRRAADIPLPPSPGPVTNSPLEVTHPVQPPSDNSMDLDVAEQPSEPTVQSNDSIHPHAPDAATPHASTATATQSSCPSSPPSNNVKDEEDDDACFDLSPEQKRQRALDKGKGRALYDEAQESPVALEPANTTATTTDQQEQETKNIAQEEDRSPTPTPVMPSRRRYRPILTTRASHGWVWNQVRILFTPFLGNTY
jgi:hypothetical protein